MYKILVNKKDELLDGRTITFISDKIGISREYLSNILNGNTVCSKMIAYCIVKYCNSEAEIEDYFEHIK